MKENAPDWLPVATLVVASVAAVAGPSIALVMGFVTRNSALRIAREQTSTAIASVQSQIHANVVSSNRQKWVDSLRDELAEFLAERDLLTAKLNDIDRDAASVRQSSARLTRLFHQLQLRLNPNEEDHRRILELADELSGKPKDELNNNMIGELVSLAQAVLKREWNRVKAGE